MIKYKNLVCEGGGIKCIAFYGAIKKLHDLGLLSHFKRFAGSSAGSLISIALACKYTLPQIKELLVDTDFSKFKDDSWGVIADSYRLIEHYGWYKGDYIYEWLGSSLENITGNKDITFKDVHDKYNTELVITGTNITKAKTDYFKIDTHPDMPIRLAARISTCIPFVFKAVKYNDDIYVDGGLFNNYPIWIFPDTNKTLGLKLMGSDEKEDSQLYHVAYDTHNLKNFTESLINGLLIEIERGHIHGDYWKQTVPIYCGSISPIKFEVSLEEKQALIDSGFKGTSKYFKSK